MASSIDHRRKEDVVEISVEEFEHLEATLAFLAPKEHPPQRRGVRGG
jgi:hypothetical protein